MLSNWIKRLLAAFKQKNPTVWVAIAALLTAAQIVIDQLVAAGTIPESAEWVEWVVWVIGLMLGSGELAATQFKNQLKSSEARAEKMIHLSDKDKLERIAERNKVLEEIVRKA